MGQTKYDPGYDNRRPWNVGKFVGAKRPLTPKQVWKVRFHLEREQNLRDLALFDLACRLQAARLRCDRYPHR